MPKEHGRILLVYPPYDRLYNKMLSTDIYPLSLGYLAGTIKKETDWDVVVYNADFVTCSNSAYTRRYPLTYLCGEGFSNYLRNLVDVSYPVWKEVRSTIHSFKPSIVGIYCCSANLACVSMVARLAKECDRSIKVIVGGPHPTSVGAETLADSNIDVAVMGEGERTLVEILKAVEDSKPLCEIKGIIYRADSKVVETPVREHVADLDSLCFPHEYAPQVLKDYKSYPKYAFQTVMTTRGCNRNCYFCGSRYMFGRRIRYRSVENVTEELKSLTKMGVRRVHFVDDTFGSDKEYTRQLCGSFIQNLKGLQWSCFTRADVVDDQTAALMKKAGCCEIAIGVESGNDEMLRRMRKGSTVQTAINAARIIRKHGIRLVAFFMIGFPGETEKTLSDTLEAMKQIDGEIVYNIFTPYPGTEAFDLCMQTGLIGSDYNPAFFNHQSPENCFCAGISKERFRELASKIEKYVDSHNSKEDLRERTRAILTFDTLRRMPDYGLVETIRRFLSVVRALVG